jgi:hypothetical protein
VKALTLWQPWASLIALGEKQIETRPWSTRYRGPLAIHAAKRWTKDQQTLTGYGPFSRALRRHALVHLPLGVVVATCTLVDCLPITPTFVRTLSDRERTFGDFSLGRWAWILDDVEYLQPPLPARGQQGLWEWRSP